MEQKFALNNNRLAEMGILTKFTSVVFDTKTAKIFIQTKQGGIAKRASNEDLAALSMRK